MKWHENIYLNSILHYAQQYIIYMYAMEATLWGDKTGQSAGWTNTHMHVLFVGRWYENMLVYSFCIHILWSFQHFFLQNPCLLFANVFISWEFNSIQIGTPGNETLN